MNRFQTLYGIALLAVLNTFLYGAIMFVPYALFFPTIFHELILNWSALPVFRDWLSYVLAAAACCFVHYFLSKKELKIIFPTYVRIAR